MAKANQLEQVSLGQNKNSNVQEWLMLYANVIINSVIFLIVMLFFNFVILRGIFKLSVVTTFIITFFIIVMLSPLTSKINLGKNIMLYYFNWLERKFGDLKK